MSIYDDTAAAVDGLRRLASNAIRRCDHEALHLADRTLCALRALSEHYEAQYKRLAALEPMQVLPADRHLSACLAALDEAQRSPLDLLGPDRVEVWTEKLVCAYLGRGPRQQREHDVMHVLDQMMVEAASKIGAPEACEP